MFVGVGASRVRDLFDTLARPRIIFIDEIDAVTVRQKGGGYDERDIESVIGRDGWLLPRSVIVGKPIDRWILLC